jgi:NAD(P)H-hydrate epimerase
MIIKISSTDEKKVKEFFSKINLPKKESHKGQNGRVLVIGGSSLFHTASIWAAEVASYFADIVHYSSTKENAKIFLAIKKKFMAGIVVPHQFLPEYVEEDDVVLIGPGMLREKIQKNKQIDLNFNQILKIKNEAKFSRHLTAYLFKNFSLKKFVIDAGALQMMDKNWLLELKTTPIVTPHQIEFKQLFAIDLADQSLSAKIKIVKETAQKYHCVILLKAISDIVSDGQTVYLIEGGNQGLSKGGTGDVLASLSASFFIKNPPLIATAAASLLIKKTADELFNSSGYWYNVNCIIESIPKTLRKIIFNQI